MANPFSFSTFDGLSASEIAAMQSGTRGQEPRDTTFPLIRTYQARPPQPYQRQQLQQQPAQRYHQQPSVLYPRQRPPSQRPTVRARSEFWQRFDRPFPFRREYTRRIFNSLLEKPGFQLPIPIRPDQVGRGSHPDYCPYHRMLGHPLEDCITFKEWLEKGIIEGSVVLPAAYLVDPPASSASFAVSPPDSSMSSSDD